MIASSRDRRTRESLIGHTRVVVPALTELAAIDRPPPSAPSPVVSAWRAYDAELAKVARALVKAA